MKWDELVRAGEQAEEGRWVTYGADFEVRIAPIGNRAFDAEIQRLSRPLLARRRKGRLTPDEMLEMNRQAMAKHVVLDWRGLTDPAGKEIPYSPEKCLELFTVNHAFYKDVVELATEMQAEASLLVEDAEGNSKRSSGGVSSGDPHLAFLEARREAGHAVPALSCMPELYEDLLPAWRAFCDLSRSRRSSGFGPQPIAPADIAGWLAIHDVDPAERAAHYRWISVLDAEWMSFALAQLNRRAKAR